MTARTLKVMVVEDSNFLRKATTAVLTSNGFRVIEATDGERAVELAKQELPDAILLDMVMPKLQGHEVMQQLNLDPRTAEIPVVVLSGMGDDSMTDAANAAGALAVLPKQDQRVDQLGVVIRRLLREAASRPEVTETLQGVN